MELRADRFERQLASEPLRPAYLIAGSEPLIVQECADAVRAKARADGYTERQVFDAGKDFDFITVAVQAPNVLVVPAASPLKTVRLLGSNTARCPSLCPGT